MRRHASDEARAATASAEVYFGFGFTADLLAAAPRLKWVHSAAAGVGNVLKSGIADTWFAWSGPTTVTPGRNGTAYYRIQGPNLVIEYAPQPLGGDPSLHIHTMYRDPANDYGRKLTAK